MAAILVLVWLAFLLLSTAVSSDVTTVSVHRGEAVVLMSGLQRARPMLVQDVRWSSLTLLVSLKNNRTQCHHGRCELLSDGSLNFSRISPDDAGEYVLEVFDENGKRVLKRRFELEVEGEDRGGGASANRRTGLLVTAAVLLLFTVVFCILRRSNQTSAASQLENNIYMEMHSCHDNPRMAQKTERDLEPIYVPCHPVVTMEVENMQQMSAGHHDIMCGSLSEDTLYQTGC
ncbi:uncharacterized protein LOC117516727 [Thalassophryne amazonica]|uniref:uncharacterized protein LOC117516727 n=1 Tax=Thalassophryne amazonica TaxID=390379 RepID=UPI00147140FD|nr:uncharacterized protein LOC117516727 [Thalassophryne amazonica]XP_034033449.1 uncharacterized protein LOC117516727 [Thalassophryne amazonica]